MSESLELYKSALRVQSDRLGVISKNISNANTPGFKAQDIDFRSVLGRSSAVSLGQTNIGHMSLMNRSGLSYVIPSSPSLDGNTVDIEEQKVRFAEANRMYSEALEFASGSVKTRMMILKGHSQ